MTDQVLPYLMYEGRAEEGRVAAGEARGCVADSTDRCDSVSAYQNDCKRTFSSETPSAWTVPLHDP